MEMGLIMSLVAVSVVFLSLAVLALLYHLTGKLFVRMDRAKDANTKDTKDTSPRAENSINEEEEVAAAIAMALEEHTNIHDRESYIITIRRRN